MLLGRCAGLVYQEMVGWNLWLMARGSEREEALARAVCTRPGVESFFGQWHPADFSKLHEGRRRAGHPADFLFVPHPRGNAETERVMRTIKEECLWLNEFSSSEQARATIEEWIREDYNWL